MTGAAPGPFDPAVLGPDPERRSLLLGACTAALAAVDPYAAVRRHLEREGEHLTVGGATIDLGSVRRVVVLALGKAAVPMARAAGEVLAGSAVCGVVTGEASVPGFEAIPGGHPEPDAGSVAAGTRMLELAAAAGPGDLVVCLVSGGGSAMCEVPAAGLDLAGLAATTALLLRSGAPIDEVNTVRRRLSALKGGRLAAAAAPAGVITLALSDVVGRVPAAIASGPTVPDPAPPGAALAVIDRRGLRDRVPAAVLRHLEAEDRTVPVSPGSFVIIGDGVAAADAAARFVAAAGVPADVRDSGIGGEARAVGAALAAELLDAAGPRVLVWAGETTVTVRGAGFGGRNQEAALGAARVLAGNSGAVFLSFATDGRDGPTDAAGGIGDGGTVDRARRAGLDPDAALAANDAYRFLAAAGDLLLTGPTGTNVADLMLGYRD